MSSSISSVHPMDVEVPPINAGPAPPPRRLLRMPGSLLRLLQFIFAVPAIYVMATADGFYRSRTFVFLVVVLVIYVAWTAWEIVVELHSVLYHNLLQNSRILGIFTIVDGVMLALLFAAACASMGVTIFMGSDTDSCPYSRCPNYATATILTFLSLFAASPIFMTNFATLVGLEYFFAVRRRGDMRREEQ